MDSRTALLNAPRPLRRAVALAAPVIVAALGAAAILAVTSALAARADRIATARQTLGLLHLLVSADPGPASTPAADDAPEFWSGGSPALIQAAMQARLSEIAAASGAALLAVGTTQVTERDGTRFAGLRASLTGTNAQIVETVFAVESALPYLTIRTARIDAADTGVDAGQADPTVLQIELELEGALLPDTGDAP